MNGLLVLDKPGGPSSLEAARRAARALGVRRVGHGGTLDPAATGVLLVCLGEATKLAPFLLEGDKEYEAEIAFGLETDTLDAAGRVLARADASGLGEAAVRAALPAFTGPLEQRPPMYSAVRRGGRRLYELARAGQEVERAPRAIVIRTLELLGFAPGERPCARVRVACSKGTYIRVLAADLGRALGPGAHLRALRRIRSGPFRIEEAVGLAEVAPEAVRPLAQGLPDWPALRLPAGTERRVRDGQPPSAGELALAPGVRVRLLDQAGALVALAETGPAGSSLRLLRVFNSGLTEGNPSAILTTN